MTETGAATSVISLSLKWPVSKSSEDGIWLPMWVSCNKIQTNKQKTRKNKQTEASKQTNKRQKQINKKTKQKRMVTWHAILLPNGMRLSMPTQSCSYCMGGSSLGTDKATTTTTKWQQQQYWHVVQSKSGNTTEFRISGLSQDLIEQNKPQNVVRLIHFCIKLYIILTLFTECRRMKASQKIDQLYIFYNV